MIGQLLLAAGMVITGLVTAFPLLVVTQVLWGLGWAFLEGADVAWLNDELNDPRRIARALTASSRWDLAGGATGMIAFGLLSWATSLATAIVVAGAAMAALALIVVARFTERNYTPTRAALGDRARDLAPRHPSVQWRPRNPTGLRRDASAQRRRHGRSPLIAVLRRAARTGWLTPQYTVGRRVSACRTNQASSQRTMEAMTTIAR